MTDTTPLAPDHLESVGPSLYLGAASAPRSTRLGPAWAGLCGLIASAAFTFDGPNLLMAALVFVVVDWAWPAVWATFVRTDWAAPLAHWPGTPASPGSIRLPFLQTGSPGDRLLGWADRVSRWWRASFAPTAGVSLVSGLVALIIALLLSAVVGWRALALTLAMFALTGLGTLRARRTGLDSDALRAMVYGTLAWWLGHAAFAPLTVKSALFGILFGLAYRALMEGPRGAAALVAPQIAGAVALFAGNQPAAAFGVMAAVTAQSALKTFLADSPFARSAQAWLMIAMLVCAIVIA